eukprot:s642_g10.t1
MQMGFGGCLYSVQCWAYLAPKIQKIQHHRAKIGNSAVIFAGEDAKDVCCSKTDCPEGYELVDGACEKPKCKGKLVQGCYLTNYTQCDSTYIKYETEYIQCGVSGPNCLSDAVCSIGE